MIKLKMKQRHNRKSKKDINKSTNENKIKVHAALRLIIKI